MLKFLIEANVQDEAENWSLCEKSSQIVIVSLWFHCKPYFILLFLNPSLARSVSQ